MKSCTVRGLVLRPPCCSLQQLLASWLACGPPKNETNRTSEVLLFVIQHLYTNLEDPTERASPSSSLKAFDQLLNLPDFHVPVRCAGVVRHLPRAVWTCWKRESNFSLLAPSAWLAAFSRWIVHNGNLKRPTGDQAELLFYQKKVCCE